MAAFEEVLQVVLRSAGLRENDGFAVDANHHPMPCHHKIG